MDNVLVISDVQKHCSYFEFMLKSFNVSNITFLTTSKQARSLLLKKEFDLVIVDSPLVDELGKNLSIEIKEKTLSQVIYCVDSISYEQNEKELSKIGVLTLQKPFNRKYFNMVLKTCITVNVTIKQLSNENKILSKQIEEIKTIDRAKCILISVLSMNEKQAHKYIEKQAMDFRISKLEIANRILKTYEH